MSMLPAYVKPTQAQKHADIALKMLYEMGVECKCVYGESPPESYFPWPGGHGIEAGTMLPSYVPVIESCKLCDVANVLHGIIDPDDMAGNFT